jgi:hypothetical protein
MRTEGWKERLRELDETAMALRMAQHRSKNIVGWLRTVRRAVDVPAAEVAGRMGVVLSDLYRMECAEGREAIESQTLRRAAEALGCDLVYGLAPKEETLMARAERIEAERAQRRLGARERKLDKDRKKRLEAATTRWQEQEQLRVGAEWQEYWRLWAREMPASARFQIPKPVKEMPFWRKQMAKALKTELRKKGIRLR